MGATRPKDEKDRGDKRKNDEVDKSNKKKGPAVDEAETQSLSQAMLAQEEAIVSQERAHLFVALTVQESTGDNVIQYKMKPAAPLKKLMDNYASKRGLNVNAIRFLFDGKRVNMADTPAQLRMENDDIIEVMSMQDGGGFY